MAPAPPADHLRKIGLEAFAIIDKFYGTPPRRGSANNGFGMFQVPNGEMAEPAINSRDAALRYGGIMIVNYPHKGKPQKRSGQLGAPTKP